MLSVSAMNQYSSSGKLFLKAKVGVNLVEVYASGDESVYWSLVESCAKLDMTVLMYWIWQLEYNDWSPEMRTWFVPGSACTID